MSHAAVELSVDWGSPPPIGERGGQVQMRARNPAVVLSAARDIAVVLRNELHGARRSDSGEGGNRKGIHSNKIKHLQPKQVPQECLMDFRLLLEHPPRAYAWLQAESTSDRTERTGPTVPSGTGGSRCTVSGGLRRGSQSSSTSTKTSSGATSARLSSTGLLLSSSLTP